jgi:FkbM family methyltransferase
VIARVHAPWRRLFAHRSVFRDVQGVGLWMPWSHRLPDYVAVCPDYGQNLVELAALLSPPGSAEPLHVLDVGANIGDSAKQILDQVDARVLAVEADPYYLDYLRRNVGDRADVTIAPVLLTTASDSEREWSPSRRGGTTHFRERDASAPAPAVEEAKQSLSISRIRGEYPAFDSVRLIKSDTDGYDTRLIPFFEYDPALTSSVSGSRAEQVWSELSELGYDRVGFWANDGLALASVPCEGAGEVGTALLTAADRRVDYLDAVAVHADDPVGQAAVAALFDVPAVGG